MISRKKYVIISVMLAIMVFIGIINVNIQYNKINGNAYNEAVYTNVFDDGRKRSDVFGEILLDKKKGIKLRMYFSKSPFDLRFSIGNKIIYINSGMFKGNKEKITSKEQTTVNSDTSK